MVRFNSLPLTAICLAEAAISVVEAPKLCTVPFCSDAVTAISVAVALS